MGRLSYCHTVRKHQSKPNITVYRNYTDISDSEEVVDTNVFVYRSSIKSVPSDTLIRKQKERRKLSSGYKRFYQGLMGRVMDSPSLSSSSHEWRQAESRASVALGSFTLSALLIIPRGSAGQSRLNDNGAPGKEGLVIDVTRLWLCSFRIERGTRPGRS